MEQIACLRQAVLKQALSELEEASLALRRE
jgi:hypothetical protein